MMPAPRLFKPYRLPSASNKNLLGSNHTHTRPASSIANLTSQRFKTPAPTALTCSPSPRNKTLPSSVLPFASRRVHQMAKLGFGSGTNDHYDNARPSYPQEALAALYTSIPKTEEPLKIVEYVKVLELTTFLLY